MMIFFKKNPLLFLKAIQEMNQYRRVFVAVAVCVGGEVIAAPTHIFLNPFCRDNSSLTSPLDMAGGATPHRIMWRDRRQKLACNFFFYYYADTLWLKISTALDFNPQKP